MHDRKASEVYTRIELSQDPGEQTWSDDYKTYIDGTELDSSKISTSGTAFASATGSTASASSIQSSAAGPIN